MRRREFIAGLGGAGVSAAWPLAAGERTMVALVFGQSQAANVVREQFVGGGHVFNYFRVPMSIIEIAGTARR
jgi:hypothetical protein